MILKIRKKSFKQVFSKTYCIFSDDYALVYRNIEIHSYHIFNQSSSLTKKVSNYNKISDLKRVISLCVGFYFKYYNIYFLSHYNKNYQHLILA